MDKIAGYCLHSVSYLFSPFHIMDKIALNYQNSSHDILKMNQNILKE